VGIDPGTTIGIVVLNEDGSIELNLSGKNLSTEEIINILKDIEGIVLISTDKAKIPKKIIEISSKLNVGVYSPDRDIPLKKKKRFYEDDRLKSVLNNNHEIDAYIAAYFALIEIKDIIEKAKRVARDDKEYIEILRVSLKNRKIEPFSAKEILEDKRKINNKVKIRRKALKSKKVEEVPDIIIEVKNEKIEDYYKKLLEDQIKKYIALSKDYDELSEIILEKVSDEKIVPKISFLIKKNKKYNRVFIDDFSDNVKEYIIRNKPKIFVKKEDFDKIAALSSEIYIVLKYRELRNFVIIDEYDVSKKVIDVNVEKIKKIIDSLRYGKVL